MSENPYIELKNITKTFGPVIANDHINFQIRKGEIHALLGENGSGKSTLMNILTGIYSPDFGDVFIDGKRVDFRNPSDSLAAGIGMIHQHVKLVEVLSAEENIIAGIDKKFYLNKREIRAKIKKIAAAYGLNIDPEKKVYQMSISEKQTIEILKAFYKGVNILILDEPTAVLTPQETKVLYKTLINMKTENCAIVLISHKLNEVMEISDRVTVLRKGKSIFTVNTSATNEKELAEKMVGKAIEMDIIRSDTLTEKIHKLLEVKDLTVENKRGQALLDNVSLEVNSGEIHGIAGIAGSGQRELCEAITGLIKIKSGAIIFKDQNITGMLPKTQIAHQIKIGFVPEDRLGMGLVADMSIAENIRLRNFDGTKSFFINSKQSNDRANSIIKKYDIRSANATLRINNLSGGNIQKVLLGRELDIRPALLVTAYPVRGLDVGASNEIYRLLDKEKTNGMGVLFIGEDLDVLLGLCDRITVLHQGRLMDTVDAKKTTKKKLGLLMMGHKGDRIYA